MSIKVGVRVRPFNQREQELNCRLCVEMQGTTTRLINLDDGGKHRDFAFDYSFWSHDQFQTEQSGYFRPTSKKYADQELVYNAVGKQILDNAWLGYHCCLFAYGQTGSGKSYSMIGYGANKGIVPIACEEIFKRTNQKAQNQEFQVLISMLEIYNEKVQDLLIPVNKRPKQGLKVRQHKKFGIFVQGLSKHLVTTYQGIQAWMQEGNTHRSVAATEMNANSSRAHTVIAIELKQNQIVNGQKLQKFSIINLVDLAGSQRIQKTGATGTTLIQATNINKSLTVLGRVIENLADRAMGKGKGTVTPYRQSALTRILQNALGGNSKTLMICAISPATDNYDQTLSTLKYADQAKKIQNKAIVNQNQTDKMIRQLTQQNDRLKKMMEHFNKMGINLMDEDALKNFNEMKNQFALNADLMNDAMTVPTLSKQQSNIQRIDQTKPHIVNLNEDPLLSRKIKYSLQSKKETTIGRKNAEPANDIIVGGVGILKHHAVIISKQNGDNLDFYLNPLNKEESNCYVNGQLIEDQILLFHEDRLIFGTTSTFLLLLPGLERRIGSDAPKDIDYEFAQEELLMLKRQQQQKQEQQQKQRQIKQKEQQQRKLLEKQLQFEKMKQELQKQTQKSKQQIMAKTAAQKQKYQHELEVMKQQIQNQRKKLQQASKKLKAPPEQKNVLQTRISRYIPKTIEMNLIAKEFNRNIHTELKLSLLPQTLESTNMSNNQKFVRIIKIHVENRELGYNYNWDVDEFNERYHQVKYLWEKYLETNQLPSVNPEQDPFYDPPIELQIGSGFLTTLSLAHLLDNQAQLALVHDNGECGTIAVNLIPTDETGQVNLSQQMQQTQEDFEPQHLLGKPMYFKIVIQKAKIPDNYSNIYVEYDVKLDNNKKQTFKTKIIKQKINNPVFNYSKTHKIQCVTQQMIDFMLEGHLCFKVYGQQYTNIQPIKKVEKVTQPPQKKITTTVKPQQPPSKPTVRQPSMNISSAQQDMKKKMSEAKKPSASSKKKDDNCLLF